jgi:hypothetical protein
MCDFSYRRRMAQWLECHSMNREQEGQKCRNELLCGNDFIYMPFQQLLEGDEGRNFKYLNIDSLPPSYTSNLLSYIS